MAQKFTTTNGTLLIPGSYSTITVQSSNSGLATTGTLMLVGESDLGPDYTQEDDLESNAFGPDQLSDVIAKYGSGPIVDAFRAAASPSTDPNITGSFSQAIIVKTNPSTKASGALGSYGTLYAQLEGKSGNLITYDVVAAVSETVPTTGAFTFIPAVGTVDAELRLNGGAALSASFSANATPATFTSTIDGLAGIGATGGANRNIITVSGTLAVDANPGSVGATVVAITRSIAWAVNPQVGDTLIIPPSSPIAGASEGNVGGYVVTAATTTSVTATKLSDAGKNNSTVNIRYSGEAGGPFQVGETITGGTSGATGVVAALHDYGTYGTLGFNSTTGTFVTGETLTGGTSGCTATSNGAPFAAPVPGTLSNPVDVTATTILATTDLSSWSPVTISVDSGSVIDGFGKSLEIASLTTGTDLLTRNLYNLSVTPVSWVSTSATPELLTSATEYEAELDVARTTDNISEALIAGGDVALKVHYVGTTATLTIDKTAGTMATTVVGGSGASVAAFKLTDYPTIADLVTFLNSQTGYSAAVGNAALGQLPLSALDSGTFNICSKYGAYNGRIKVDAYKFYQATLNSALVQFGDPAAAANSGLPVVQSISYLSGGTKGPTTSSTVLAAIDALSDIRGNFVVPLFSRDASLDIIDGLTESGSTYTISGINLAVKSHVLAMSTLKKRKNRQGFLSLQDTFENQKEAASNIASSRCSMAFQDFKQLNSAGVVIQFQPWMGAVLAASMQAAGFYRAIFFKNINTAGVVQAAGDFNPNNDTQMEEALLAGLLPAKKSLTGGFVFQSDQTTYTKDDNFVFNSIQAMYAADTIALTASQRMEQAFIGQSVADISAALALTFFEGIMADFLRLKLIAPSDDAPGGFKNVSMRINGGNLLTKCEIKLAGALYFNVIDFLVSPVVQSA